MMDVIKIKDLTKIFSIKKGFQSIDFKAVDNISVTVKKGEFFGIIGPNGAGKSTLLRLITDIIKPTSGSIEIKGKILSFIELGVGFNEELTGRENTFLYGSLLGIPYQKLKENIESLIHFSGLGKFFDSKLKTYSTGMRVRLAFSIVTLTDPDILIIDEILAVGDEEFQEKSVNFIKNFNKEGKTVIIVSHDLGRIKALCDKVALIKNGKLIKVGDPIDVVSSYYDILEKNEVKIDLLKKQDVKENFLTKITLKTKEQKEISNKIDFYRHKLVESQRKINLIKEEFPLHDIKDKIEYLLELKSLLERKIEIEPRDEEFHEIIEILRQVVHLNERIILHYAIQDQEKESDNKNMIEIRKEMIFSAQKELNKYIGKDKNSKDDTKKEERKGFGLGDALIDKVKLLKDGKETDTFFTGEEFVAEISYRCRKTIKKPMFGIAIHTKDGILITGPNTTFSKHSLPYIKDKGKIKFKINSLPLLEGEYDLSSSIYDFMGETPYDHHYRLYRFVVKNRNNLEKYGVVHIDHTWSE